MKENLKNDLELLLAKHPELKNTKLIFNESDFVFEHRDDKILNFDILENPPCEQKGPFPETIGGHSPKLEIRKSPIHGYGVFAKEPIENGELIEECKILKLGNRGRYNHDPVLRDYVWSNQSCNCPECKKHGANQYLALGFGSLYNHSDNSNTKIKSDFKKEVMTIRANTHIASNMEIFVRYGEKYWIIRNIRKSINENKAWQQHLLAGKER